LRASSDVYDELLHQHNMQANATGVAVKQSALKEWFLDLPGPLPPPVKVYNLR
jgi:hypothetical protein